MTDEELVKQLRDEALDLHRSAWRDISGGQNATISATLADTTADRIEALTAERDQWIQHAKNAVWADSEELKQAEADNARLREDLEELDFLRHEGGPDSVAAMEAELKRLRAVLSDIKTASVCSVSRHVAASALGEAAA